jgi:hypothetical protein
MVSSKSASGAGFSASGVVEAGEGTAMVVDAVMELVDLDMDSLPGNGVWLTASTARAPRRRGASPKPSAIPQRVYNDGLAKTQGGKL